jgi:tetratricopeptide (TPR) repeat protein
MRLARATAALLSFTALAGTSGCSEVRGRRKFQEANGLSKDGDYKGAVVRFEEAERLVPDLPVLWLNKGFNCRQLIVPGAKTPESVAASKCALASFSRYKELKPDDQRGDLLYVQTLFDSDEFETLAKMYEDRYKRNPKDIEAVQGLMQVYSKWGKIDDALQWYRVSADLRGNDAEAQYGVGVFIYQQLFMKGGGPEKGTFDPRPDPNKPKDKKVPPPFAYGDIIAQQRIDYSDEGIKYLKKALELRPTYTDAMTYINLLNRQKSYAFFDQPEEWQKAVDEAELWKKKTLELLNAGKPAAPKPADAATPAAADKKAPEAAAPKAAKVAKKTKGGKRHGRK